jgi:hypothetical protein
MLYSQSPPLADEQEADRGAHDPDDRPQPQFGRRRAHASIHSLPPPRRPSIGRRMFRAVTRFVIALAIGVGVTLGWQAYGDMAKEMLAARAPELAWVLAYMPATKPPVAAAAAASPALQLEPLVSRLEFMRRSVEQLAAKQEQMAQSIAAMRAADEDIRMKLALAAQPPVAAQPAAPVPQQKPAQPRAPSAAAPSSAAPRPSPTPGPLSIAPSR